MELIIAVALVVGLVYLFGKKNKKDSPPVTPLGTITIGMSSDDFVDMCLDDMSTEEKAMGDPWVCYE